MQKLLVIYFLLAFAESARGQANATVKEYQQTFKTYPFSDPDPIPNPGLIYPYYRFDGYTDKAVDKAWKVVDLENEFIKVMILPEIGGKIWTAIEKSTGKPFIYFNHVVKFRDIAMRGPWTSGGIEANYGIIGHTPNCATPVDYWNTTNEDGSVSCFIGTLDLLTQTYWTIEINLPKDKAYFTTRSFWYNSSEIEQPYYTWMNAGIKAKGNLQFIYPGNKYLGHNGEYADWPVHAENGKDISFYENNNFGGYKSYHVFGKYTNFFGGYWHDEDFGMGHYALHGEKPGKKIWIWGLSNQGMIWEKLLTDTDGQYVEVQSGRLFNQTAEPSTFTPFKHRGFAPGVSDSWKEYWFPAKGTGGMVKANPFGSLNVSVKPGVLEVAFSPLQSMEETLLVKNGEEVIFQQPITFKTLEVFKTSIPFSGDKTNVTVAIGDKLEYALDEKEAELSRPQQTVDDFDWNTVYGYWLQAKERIRERSYSQAEELLGKCLTKNPNYMPALTDLAMLNYRKGANQKALSNARHALQIDSYDPAANYYYALASKALDRMVDAKDGLDMATQSMEYRSVSFAELGKLYLIEGNFNRAIDAANNSLRTNIENVEALQIKAMAFRKLDQRANAEDVLTMLEKLNPLNHFVRFEKYVWNTNDQTRQAFTATVQNEMPEQTYLQLAIWYASLNNTDEAIKLLRLAPQNLMINYWQAFLLNKNEKPFEEALTKATSDAVALVFPFRKESITVLQWVARQTDDWKPRYLLGLIYWGNNQLEEARSEFIKCGQQPQFAPFYAAKANLFKSNGSYDPMSDLQKAAQLDPGQWRYGKLLVNHFIEANQVDKAVVVAQTYHQRFKENYILSMVLAKVLLKAGQYTASAKLLDNTTILPYEGATDGRMLYKNVWLIQAVERMEQKDYKKALSFIQKAKEWPEHLGVGKPYDADIDGRLEDYLWALCYTYMRKEKLAEGEMDKVLAFHQTFSINDLITALAYRKSGQQEKGENILMEWKNSFPDNRYADWSYKAFTNGKSDLAVIKDVLLQNN